MQKPKKTPVTSTMQKNIKCNEINRSKIDSKYFFKKNQSVFYQKKLFETISFHLQEIISNNAKENATFLLVHKIYRKTNET